MTTPEWLATALPFLKGALGWTAVAFVNENLVKPARARRRLATVLAAEVQLNLQMAVYQQEHLKFAPKTVPADFVLHSDVYRALLARLADLSDDLVGELVLFYQRVAILNADTQRLLSLIDELQRLKTSNADGSDVLRATKEQEATRTMQVWIGHFPVLIRQGDGLLRRLRVAETPMGRIGYFFRRKPSLDLQQVRTAVERRAAELESGR